MSKANTNNRKIYETHSNSSWEIELKDKLMYVKCMPWFFLTCTFYKLSKESIYARIKKIAHKQFFKNEGIYYCNDMKEICGEMEIWGGENGNPRAYGIVTWNHYIFKNYIFHKLLMLSSHNTSAHHPSMLTEWSRAGSSSNQRLWLHLCSWGEPPATVTVSLRMQRERTSDGF